MTTQDIIKQTFDTYYTEYKPQAPIGLYVYDLNEANKAILSMDGEILDALNMFADAINRAGPFSKDSGFCENENDFGIDDVQVDHIKELLEKQEILLAYKKELESLVAKLHIRDIQRAEAEEFKQSLYNTLDQETED